MNHNLPSSRNYGIDLLRIVSMTMVVLLHCLSQGGILSSAPVLSARYEIAWFLEIMAYCAVNCYALISGYVGYGRKVKFSNLIHLVLQVTFYTLLITGIFAIFIPGTVGLRTILKALFPIGYDSYWYITAYFCLFFFLPFLNEMVENTSQKRLRQILWTMVFILCLLPTFYQVDLPKTQWGYSPLWLVFLYLLGAYVQKYDLLAHVKSGIFLWTYLFFGAGTWLFRLLTEIVTSRLAGHSMLEGYLIRYTSPTILLCALSLFLFFTRIQLGKVLTAFTKFFAPAALGVYLIHTEPLIWEYWLRDAFTAYVSLPAAAMFFALLGTAIGIWLLCSLLDRLRMLLFRLLHVKTFSAWLERKIRLFLDLILHKFHSLSA